MNSSFAFVRAARDTQSMTEPAAIAKLDETALKPAEDAPLPTMEQWRDATFRDRVVERLRAGQAAGQPAALIFQTMAEEQRALGQALTSEPVAVTAAETFHAAKQMAVSEPALATSMAHAQETLAQILIRRAEEAKSYAAQLADPAFQQAMEQAAQAGKRFSTASLEAIKTRETVDELLHVGADGKAQVLAHMDAFRDGTVITHRALAEVFAPNGPLATPLAVALGTHLPQADAARLTETATTWLADRHAAATTTVTLLGNDGAAYKQAVDRSLADHPGTRGLTEATPLERLKSPVLAQEI